MFKGIFKLTVTSSLTLLFGLFSQFFLLFYFGASYQTDAHIASLTLPLLISSLIVTTLPQVLVPIFVNQSNDRKASWDVFLLLAVVFTIITCLLFFLAPIYIPILFFGLDLSTQNLAVELTRIQCWGVLAAGLNVAPSAYLRAREKTLVLEVRTLIASVVCIVFIVPVTTRYGVFGASLVLMIRSWVQLVLLLPLLGMPESKKVSISLYRELWQRYAPIIFTAPIYKLGPVLDRVLASSSPMGQLSSLVYGQQLWNSGLRIADKSLSAPFLTRASKYLERGNMEMLNKDYQSVLRIFLCISLLVVFFFLFFGEGMIAYILNMRDIGSGSLNDFWIVTLMLSGTFVASGCSQMSSAVMYSLGETQSLSRIAIINFLISSAIKIAFFFILGIIGIAIACIVYPLLNHIMFHRKITTIFSQRNI